MTGRYVWMFIPLVILVLSALAVVLIYGRPPDRGYIEKHNETKIALAYACGYRVGQIAITSRLPSLFTNEKDKAEKLGGQCPDIQFIARKHGFTQ